VTWLDCATSNRQAANYGGGLDPSLIVVHSAETPELEASAEGVAAYFASGSTIGSVHATTDADSIVGSVPLERVCYGTGEGGVNGFAWQIEQAGYASQDRGEWLDVYSRATITNTATVIKEMIRRKPAIRPVFLSAEQLAAGERWGITSHGECHQAWPQGDVRTDPGAEYPWDVLLGMVANQPSDADVARFFQLLADLQEANDMQQFRVMKVGTPGPAGVLVSDDTRPEVYLVNGLQRSHAKTEGLLRTLQAEGRLLPPTAGVPTVTVYDVAVELRYSDYVDTFGDV